MRATIRVPASVANLGPGFDILALALQLQNDVIAEGRDGGAVSVEVEGEGADGDEPLTDPEHNLVARSYVDACTRLDVPAPMRGAHLRCVNRVPLARGLGSSAAATVSGVLAAVALHRAPWDDGDVLRVCADIEGHADNAAAALHGGLAICAPGAAVQRIDVADELHCVVFCPSTRLATAEARRVVPPTMSRADAVFNAARCALLVRALTLRDHGALREAMDDRWHQAQRAALFPAIPDLIGAAYDAGSVGACLAGAGPSVLALCVRDPDAVGAALTACAASHGIDGTTLTLRPRNFGARVEVRA